MPIKPLLVLATFVALTIPSRVTAAPAAATAGATVSLPVADARVTAKAKEWFHRLQTGEIDRSQLDAQVNSQLTENVIHHETETLTPLGEPISFAFVRTYPVGGALEYDFMVGFKAAKVIELISFDADGKIAGLGFEPARTY